jgi:hypothetical protein
MKAAIDMKAYPLVIESNRFPVFLYALEQLKDKEASAELRHGLESFIGLSSPLELIGHENQNHHSVGANAFAETIDICDKKYKSIRDHLTHEGAKTAKWIREKFLQSHDVIVPSKETFSKYLDNWALDPCQPMPTAIEI